MASKELTPTQQETADQIVEAIVAHVPFFLTWGNRTGKTTVLEYVDRKLEYIRTHEAARHPEWWGDETDDQRRAAVNKRPFLASIDPFLYPEEGDSDGTH